MGNPIKEAITTDRPHAVVVPFKFLHSEDSGKVLAKAPKGAAAVRLILKKKTGFDGAGATITIGTAADPDRLAASATVDPANTGLVVVELLEEFTEETEIIITVGGGANAAGELIGALEYIFEFDKQAI